MCQSRAFFLIDEEAEFFFHIVLAIYSHHHFFAESLLERQQQLEGYRKILGVHPLTANCLHYLGLAHLKIGLLCDAQTCALVAYQMFQKLYGYGMETMTIFSDFGKAFHEFGNITLGVKYIEKAMRDAENVFGEQEQVASIYEELAAAKEELFQDLEEIQSLKNEANQIRKQYQRDEKVVNRSLPPLLVIKDVGGFSCLAYVIRKNLETLFVNHFFVYISVSFILLLLMFILYLLFYCVLVNIYLT